MIPIQKNTMSSQVVSSIKTLLNNTSPWVYAPENTIRKHRTNQPSFINLEQKEQVHKETGDSPHSNNTQSSNFNNSPWVYAPENTTRNPRNTNQSSFIRNTVRKNQRHTLTRDSPDVQQPPGHRTYPEYHTRGTVGKIRPNDKHNSHHVTNTASQKYEDYLREYNIHRNKCIDIIRTAFQDIRDALKKRESQRQNTEIDQTSESPQQVTGKNHMTNTLHTPDTNPHRAHTLNTRQGTTEATIGLDRQDTSWNRTTQSYHAFIYTQNTLNSKNRIKPDHNT